MKTWRPEDRSVPRLLRWKKNVGRTSYLQRCHWHHFQTSCILSRCTRIFCKISPFPRRTKAVLIRVGGKTKAVNYTRDRNYLIPSQEKYSFGSVKCLVTALLAGEKWKREWDPARPRKVSGPCALRRLCQDEGEGPRRSNPSPTKTIVLHYFRLIAHTLSLNLIITWSFIHTRNALLRYAFDRATRTFFFNMHIWPWWHNCGTYLYSYIHVYTYTYTKSEH